MSRRGRRVTKPAGPQPEVVGFQAGSAMVVTLLSEGIAQFLVGDGDSVAAQLDFQDQVEDLVLAFSVPEPAKRELVAVVRARDVSTRAKRQTLVQDVVEQLAVTAIAGKMALRVMADPDPARGETLDSR